MNRTVVSGLAKDMIWTDAWMSRGARPEIVISLPTLDKSFFY